MNSVFPFGLERPLAFYLVVYLLTWVLHAFLMAYVLAGSLWLAWTAIASGTGAIPRSLQPLSRVLREWMPFVLSGAITAGVAPLLFVQILYQQQFYTANLLLGWRWMVVIPVLIVAFYFLYAMKSKNLDLMSPLVRLGLSVATAGCFLFVAFCWTANHLLGLDAAQWPTAYASRQAVVSAVAVVLRLGTWVTGTFPTMAILAAWQLQGMRSRTHLWADAPVDTNWEGPFQQDHQRLVWMSLWGLGASMMFAVGYFLSLPEPIRSALTGRTGFVWIAALILLILIHALLLVAQRNGSCFSPWGLTVLTGTLAGILTATAVLREIVRLTQADHAVVLHSTTAASQVSGFGLFLVFTVVNVGLMAWCVHLVRKSSDIASD